MFKCPFNGVLQKSPWSDDCMNVNRALQIQLDDPSFKALRALSTYTNPRPNAPPWAKPTVWDWTNRQMAFYRLRQDKQRECLWTQHFSFVWWESLLCCRGQFFFFFSPRTWMGVLCCTWEVFWIWPQCMGTWVADKTRKWAKFYIINTAIKRWMISILAVNSATVVRTMSQVMMTGYCLYWHCFHTKLTDHPEKTAMRKYWRIQDLEAPYQ